MRRSTPQLNTLRQSLPIDGALVPGALFLIARELCLFDPPRELAWQLFHELKDVPKPAWLAPLLPHPAPVLYDDPVGLALAAFATGLAVVYLLAALLGARPRTRAALLAVAAFGLIILPTAGFIALGLATGRPYGHDGGVVQLPLALDRVLAGESPYGADYSQSILGSQARSSVFWAPLGGNPIVRHHWYLPGMHLVMAPPYWLARHLLGFFDARLVTLAAYILAALLAARLFDDPARKLAAAGVVALNPFVFWPQIFGTNDVLSAVPLLLTVLLAQRGRRTAASAMLGLACAVKQLAWPFAPFLLLHLSGIASLRQLASREGLARLARPVLIAGAVFAAIVLPVAALDFRAFAADIFRYQVGSPGPDQYPLGGTPGFGFANFLIYFGRVSSLSEYFPFQRFYLLFIPAGLLLLRFQLREGGGVGPALVSGSAALLVSLYFSRIVNPNYLVLVALLLPLGVAMMRERSSADLAVVPLLLLLLAVEVSDHELLHTTWEQATAAGAPIGLPAWLTPDPGGPRWRDPLSVGLSAGLAGLGVAYLFAAILGARTRARLALVAAAVVLGVALPTWVVVRTGTSTGTVRAQDPWLVEVLRAREAPGPGEWGRRPGYEPTPVLEAWTTSWRRDPPRPVSVEESSPGAFALGRLMKRTGLLDPRALSLAAVGIVTLLAGRLVAPQRRPLAIGAVLLSPAAAVGTVFGAGGMVVLACVLLGWLLARRGAPLTAGSALGAGGAIAPSALLLGPFAAREGPSARPDQLGRLYLGLGLGLLAAALPLLVPYAGELWRFVRDPAGLHPGVGLSNLLFYRPVDPSLAMVVTHWAAPALLIGVAIALARSESARRSPLGSAAALTAAGIFALPSMPAHAVMLPLGLLALAASD